MRDNKKTIEKKSSITIPRSVMLQFSDIAGSMRHEKQLSSREFTNEDVLLELIEMWKKQHKEMK